MKEILSIKYPIIDFPKEKALENKNGNK